MAETKPRSTRPRTHTRANGSPLPNYSIQDEYTSSWVNPDTGLTHYIYSFDGDESIVSSSGDERAGDEDEEDEDGYDEDEYEEDEGEYEDKDEDKEIRNPEDNSCGDKSKQGGGKPLDITEANIAKSGDTSTCKTRRPQTLEDCGCVCNCQKPRSSSFWSNRFFSHPVLLWAIHIIMISLIIAAFFIQKKQENLLEGLQNEVLSRLKAPKTTEETGTYFGLCGQGMDPCCYGTGSFLDSIREKGLRSFRDGFGNAIECYRHLRQSNE
ncbi:hypothetical protein TWF730_004464 [Orbilia blumenaviensis]|uniref:Uncharacterized protein n=1 Tax=Orbilia blumenaviensis TaxID=1796055 RepID=A0AAV9TXX9_9PEZI